eukprot:TRINITY_DN8392_c0_g1_i1.p2 TRINITY_DN8392_c0_g1~~TRINITY_DN8392_c0_g1_i1.p2  ORF type:complete len:101 (+),score=2.18 TRINITY_DN8392_c0_g1_i1:463-765(+)
MENIANQNPNHFDMNHHPNHSVFDRLHTASIRNTRLNLNSSINSGDMETIHETQRDSGLFNEPSRIINHQTQISKNPQRNTQNNNKSMLSNPVRVLSPDA